MIEDFDRRHASARGEVQANGGAVGEGVFAGAVLRDAFDAGGRAELEGLVGRAGGVGGLEQVLQHGDAQSGSGFWARLSR